LVRALICRDRGPAVATVVPGVMFGLWHVLPSLGVGNAGAESGVRWPALVGTVVFTGLAGLVFGELRRRSGSLLAPALLHWATNGLGVPASAAAWWPSRH
jgi:membrane protease YdiL (CAAX protease family)